MLTNIRNLFRRAKFQRLNRAEIDRMCMPESDRSDGVGGTLPASLRRWVESLNLEHAKVLELLDDKRNSYAWFQELVACHTLHSYTYSRRKYVTANAGVSSFPWEDIYAKAKDEPFDIVVLSSSELSDFKAAEAVCHSHGVIILNTADDHSFLVSYARDKGCGAIKFVSDLRTLEGTYDVSTLVFRHSAIFR